MIFEGDNMSEACYNIIEDRDIPEINCLVAGFPGNGLIGGIASEQLINTLELEQVASLDCDDFPPTAVIFDGIPRRPVRFFAGKGFLLVKSDMVIPPQLSVKLAESIIDFAIDRGIEDVIIFDGIPERDESKEENKIWGVVSSHAAEDEAHELKVELIKRGAIAGMSSSLLLEANERDMTAVGLLAEGNTRMPDPRAAAKLLEKFSEYRNIDIETDSLVESAEQLEEEFAKLVQQTKQTQSDLESRSAHPPLYG